MFPKKKETLYYLSPGVDVPNEEGARGERVVEALVFVTLKVVVAIQLHHLVGTIVPTVAEV